MTAVLDPSYKRAVTNAPKFIRKTDGPAGFEQVTHVLSGTAVYIEDLAMGGKYDGRRMVGSDPYRFRVYDGTTLVQVFTTLRDAKAFAIGVGR